MQKFIDYQILVAASFILVAWKSGDWRNWRQYHPTILFFITGQLLYSFICYNYPLWQLESPLLKSTFSDLVTVIFGSPAVVMIYLSHLPAKLTGKIAYMGLWVLIFTAIECVSLSLGYISYHNGWNIWLSMLFNCSLFPLLWLHYKKPLLASIAMMAATGIGLILFQVPLSSMK